MQVGQASDPLTGAVVPPIVLASTFQLDGIEGAPDRYNYSRSGNPTRDRYQEALASLESGAGAVAFPSGLNAEDTLVRVLTRPGDTILCGHDVYAGTGRMFTWILPREGRSTHRVSMANLDEVRTAFEETHARVLWLETPSNPLLELSDIEALSTVAHEYGAWVVVDNTFATPVFQRPIELGADIVIHSTTKYIGGHSDHVGGAAIFAPDLHLPDDGLSGSDDVLHEVRWWQNAIGSVPGAFDSWLAHRGLRTLVVRVQRSAATAQRVAEALTEVPQISQVWYPGLPTHPGHDIAARQMSGFGGVISFELDSPELARKVSESTQLLRLAASLGAAESLIEYPYAMTHASMASTTNPAPDKLVRLAIGLEDPEDLIADIIQAVEKAYR